MNKQTDRHTHKHTHTHIWTTRLIESIGPEGRCFENGKWGNIPCMYFLKIFICVINTRHKCMQCNLLLSAQTSSLVDYRNVRAATALDFQHLNIICKIVVSSIELQLYYAKHHNMIIYNSICSSIFLVCFFIKDVLHVVIGLCVVLFAMHCHMCIKCIRS